MIFPLDVKRESLFLYAFELKPNSFRLSVIRKKYLLYSTNESWLYLLPILILYSTKTLILLMSNRQTYQFIITSWVSLGRLMGTYSIKWQIHIVIVRFVMRVKVVSPIWLRSTCERWGEATVSPCNYRWGELDLECERSKPFERYESVSRGRMGLFCGFIVFLFYWRDSNKSRDQESGRAIRKPARSYW